MSVAGYVAEEIGTPVILAFQNKPYSLWNAIAPFGAMTYLAYTITLLDGFLAPYP